MASHALQLLSIVERNSEKTTIQPVDILVFKHKNASLLDTVFFSKAKKKPSWITSTTGPITTMHAVDRNGRLNEVAKIHWYQEGINSDVMVETNGELFGAEKFGRKKGHSHGEPSLDYFTIDELRCRWARVESTVGLSLHCTADIPGTSKSVSPPTSSLSKWRSIFKPSKTSDPRLLLARFSSPQGMARRDLGLQIFPDGVPYTCILLLSMLLLSSHRDDWKVMQSQRTPQELEAMISSDLSGALPAYSTANDGTFPDLHPIIETSTSSRWQPRPQTGERDTSTPAPEYDFR